MILSTIMIEAIGFSETSVLRTATCRDIPEDGILHRTVRITGDPAKIRTCNLWNTSERRYPAILSAASVFSVSVLPSIR
jgi:hypothetical protein